MFLRYITSPRNLAQLLTMCRQHQQCQNSSVLEALRAMGVTHYKCFTETSLESGLPHTHWICWTSGGPSVLLNRLQKGDSSLTSMDLEPVVALLKVTITVSLSVEALQEQFPHLSQQVAQDVVTLARRWQVHRCTTHCTTSFPEGQKCSQFFPQLPSLLNIQSRRPDMGTDAKKRGFDGVWGLHERLQELLRQHQHLEAQGEERPVVSLLALLRLLAPDPVLLPSFTYEWAGLHIRHNREMQGVLEEIRELELGLATLGDEMLLALYHYTLHFRYHARPLLARKVSEAWVVPYHPTLLLANQCNVDVSLVTHTLPRLLDYVTKGATSQTISRTAEQLEKWGGARNSSLAEHLMAEERDSREISLTEGIFILYPELHHSSTNSLVEWVTLEPPSTIVLMYSLRSVKFIHNQVISLPGRTCSPPWCSCSSPPGTGHQSRGGRTR